MKHVRPPVTGGRGSAPSCFCRPRHHATRSPRGAKNAPADANARRRLLSIRENTDTQSCGGCIICARGNSIEDRIAHRTMAAWMTCKRGNSEPDSQATIINGPSSTIG